MADAKLSELNELLTLADDDELLVADTSAVESKRITKVNLEADLDHDALTNFVADEHVAHTAVSITAGNGLSGGGDISASRTIDVDITNTTDLAAPAVADELLISDADNANAIRKADLASIVNLADHDQLTNFDAAEHFTEASIDHTAITNVGTNTHAQIDTAVTNSANHIADTSDPHGATLSQTNITLTGALDAGGATDFEIPNSAAPTVDTDGQVAIDTTVADFSHGLMKYYSGEEMAVVALPIAETVTPAGGAVPTYNATTDEFELAVPSGTGNVVGPVSSTDNAIARFDGAGGKTLQNSSILIDDSDVVSGMAGLTSTGAIDFGGATSFELPNGAAPVVNATGEMALDTTDNHVIMYDGTAARVIARTFQTVDIWIESPAAADAIKFIKVPADAAITLKRAYYYCDAATNVVFNIEERTTPTGAGVDVWTVDKTATTTEANTTSFDNGAIDAGDYLYVAVTSISGTPGGLGITLEYYIDVE